MDRIQDDLSHESCAIVSIKRSAATIGILLLIPVIPFVVMAHWIEPWAIRFLGDQGSSLAVGLATVALLTSDILLPIPSSVLGTSAGSSLGFMFGTLATWTGLTLGAAAGYEVARWFGAKLSDRSNDVQQLRNLSQSRPWVVPWLVAASRPLPILAEATILMVGLDRASRAQVYPALLLGNLGIAMLYVSLGQWAVEAGWLPVALIGAAVIPLMAAVLARNALRR